MFSTSWMYAAAPAAAVVHCGGIARADLVFNNGLENDFSGTADGNVIVADNPNGPPFATTLNLLADASNTVGSDLNVSGSSIVRVFAGSTIGDDLNATGASSVFMTGGTILDDIRVRNFSVFHLWDGSIGDSVAERGTATLFTYGYGFNWGYGATAAEEVQLTGFHSDGTALNVSFDRGTAGAFTGTIELVFTVPAPAGIVLLGFAGLRRSRRR